MTYDLSEAFGRGRRRLQDIANFFAGAAAHIHYWLFIYREKGRGVAMESRLVEEGGRFLGIAGGCITGHVRGQWR